MRLSGANSAYRQMLTRPRHCLVCGFDGGKTPKINFRFKRPKISSWTSLNSDVEESSVLQVGFRLSASLAGRRRFDPGLPLFNSKPKQVRKVGVSRQQVMGINPNRAVNPFFELNERSALHTPFRIRTGGDCPLHSVFCLGFPEGAPDINNEASDERQYVEIRKPLESNRTCAETHLL